MTKLVKNNTQLNIYCPNGKLIRAIDVYVFIDSDLLFENLTIFNNIDKIEYTDITISYGKTTSN